MIDLSYLTEEEQEVILAVLKRDTQLKNAEEQRVKQLRNTLHDKSTLKYLTGEWFYETKSQRHRDRIHGSDIIRASMRQRKPVTVLELSQIWAERPSMVNSRHQDVFVPPELSGLIEEPQNERGSGNGLREVQQERLTQATQSQSKRQNPFNAEPSTSDSSRKQIAPLSNGALETEQTPAQDPHPPSASHMTPLTNLDIPEPATATPKIAIPVPKKRLFMYSSQDSFLDSTDHAPKQGGLAAPRGILKHSSSCSSSDSLSLPQLTPASPQSPPQSPGAERVSAGWLDRKQVRFSPVICAKDTVEVQDGRELGEHDLLDQESGSTDSPEREQERTDSVPTSNGVGWSSSQESPAERPAASEAERRPCSPPSPSGVKPLMHESSIWSSRPTERLGEFLSPRPTDIVGYDERTAQIPDGQHDYHAEPSDTQVSNFRDPAKEKGKANPERAEHQSPNLSEEEGHSIEKVLEWFGRGPSGYVVGEEPEQLCLPHERVKRGEPKSPESSDTKSAGTESTTPQTASKPTPKPRRGLLALFSRSEGKEKPQFADEETQVLHDDIAVFARSNQETDCNLNPPHIAPEKNQTKDQEILTVKPREGSGVTVSGTLEEAERRENYDQVDKSPSRLANLKSFWDRGNRGPKILKIRTFNDGKDSETAQIRDNQNDVTRQRLKECVEKQQLAMPNSDTTDMRQFFAEADSRATIVRESGPVASQCRTASETGISKRPSQQEGNTVFFDISQILGEGHSESMANLAMKQRQITHTNHQEESLDISALNHSIRDEDIPQARSPLTSQADESLKITNIRSLWEKEKGSLKIIVNTSKCRADIEDVQDPTSGFETEYHDKSQLDVTSTSSDIGCVYEQRSASPYRHTGPSMYLTGEKMESGLVSMDVIKEPVTDQVMEPEDLLEAFQINVQPSSTESKTQITSLRDHTENSQDFIISQQQGAKSKLPILRHQPKAPHKGQYKEPRKDRSPLKTFAIDISSLKGSPQERQELTETTNRSNTGALSGGITSESVTTGEKSKTERMEQKYLSASKRSSEENRHAVSHSPNRHPPQPARRTSVGSTGGRQSSPCHSSTTQGQRRTSSGRPRRPSDDKPIILKERKLSNDSQHSPSHLARSLIPWNRQHYLGAPELNQMPVFPGRAERVEWIRAELQKVSGQKKLPAQPSPPDSEEITFDSTRSSPSETWSLSRTSSACGSGETSPVQSVVKRASARPMSISKSLEDISTMPPQDRRKADPRSELMQSVDDVSALPPSYTLPNPEQMKIMSMSVPAFRQQESDGRSSDSTSENSLRLGTQRMSNSRTNISTSSGMASMSSASGSVMSIYPGDFGNIEVRGTIQFAMNYVEKLSEFHIFVVQCKDLAVAEPKRNRSDPYVKSYLVPDKTKLGKRKTCVRKRTLNPSYNEILRYKVSMETLKSQSLNLSVWHNDNFGRNSFLGEVDVDLSDWDTENTQMSTYLLKGRVASSPVPMDHQGEMRVALRFLPQMSHSKRTAKTGEVQIWVKDCRNLPIVRGGGIDPYVKCTVLPDTSKKSRQKTRVMKRTANPVFNHTMVYDGFRPEDLREACVELTVWDHDRLKHHLLGGLRIGLGTGMSYGARADWMDSTPSEVSLWANMIDNPNEWVERRLPLRVFVTAKSMSKS